MTSPNQNIDSNNRDSNIQDPCQAIRQELPLLLYGELSFDEEERVEIHLEQCAACRDALAAERELLAVVDQVAVEPSPALLRQCRDNLEARLASERSVAEHVAHIESGEDVNKQDRAPGFWKQLVDMITLRPPAEVPGAATLHWARPMGAVALLAIGFISAQISPNLLNVAGGDSSFTEAGLFNPGEAHLRSVEQTPNGEVRIVLDETQRREVVGAVEDALVQRILLAASTDPSNRARVETVAILSSKPHSNEVRDALIYALRNDEDAGVRREALAGLTSFVQEPDVQSSLAEVLLNDSDPDLRMQAIGALRTSIEQEETLDRTTISKLQEAIHREVEPDVWQECQRVLEAANASAEMF